jgi:hypothetical protein
VGCGLLWNVDLRDGVWPLVSVDHFIPTSYCNMDWGAPTQLTTSPSPVTSSYSWEDPSTSLQPDHCPQQQPDILTKVLHVKQNDLLHLIQFPV